MKFISWNVNGLRACLKKGFEDVFRTLDADFFCIQETKMQPGQADFAPEGYTEYIYSADKKGYSGTAVWAKTPALSVRYGLDEDVHNHEGRAITLEYPDFYLVNLYVPNAQNELARIDYRMQWEDDLRRYLQKLDAEKPVILCGDLNVAHEDIDLKNPGPNRGAAGFSDQERGKLDELLAAGFTETPDSIQTSVYWYWISNHISADGVRRDLESMKRIGIDRAFIGNIGLEDSESGEGPVKFYSEEWWEVMHAALKKASELGIEIGIFNSPGWSQSGGPWVEPQQSMRYLASTTTHITGGRQVEIDLPRPANEWSADFQDVKVIAFPAIDGQRLTPAEAKVTVRPSASHPERLIDGDPGTAVELLPAGSRSGEVTLEFTTERPFTLRSLKLYVTEAPVDCPARIEAEQNGTFRTLAEFPVTRFNPSLNVGFDPYAPVVISVPATASTRFRLVFANATPGFGLREAELSSLPVVERYPEKTLAKMYQTPLPYWHEYMWRDQPAADDPSLVIDPNDILDISDRLEGDRLIWNAPAGEWTIMRTGMLPTGVVNSPARPEAEGLETDKMSKKHIEAHFEAFLGEIYRRIPAEDRKCWKVVVEDSYETGGQNFTDGFLEDFKARYGYDPVPFLPVYAGTVVQSEEISDRFLWDMRRLVADKIAYDYVAGLRDVSHKYGLTTWLENYGHWGFPGEFLQRTEHITSAEEMCSFQPLTVEDGDCQALFFYGLGHRFAENLCACFNDNGIGILENILCTCRLYVQT